MRRERIMLKACNYTTCHIYAQGPIILSARQLVHTLLHAFLWCMPYLKTHTTENRDNYYVQHICSIL